MTTAPAADAADRRPALSEALAYLDAHVNFETAPTRRAAPTLERMQALCTMLGEPQHASPVVHVTGTNGKGSTVRMITALLAAQGLSVGTYTSPHLERINERITAGGDPIPDDELASHLLALAPMEHHLGVSLTHFELLTAAAFSYFADRPVDVSVLEVGMGGRWDSTNVADGAVAVVTNIGLDHAEVFGPTRADIATEKSGVVKEGAICVLGETDRAVTAPFYERGASEVWARAEDFACVRSRVAVGGRVLDLRTPGAAYDDVFLPLHGGHQGDNAACAVAAVEAFFGRPLDAEVVAEALAGVRVPGRFEIVGRNPLVVLDGAHNPDGMGALARTLDEDLSGRRPEVLVIGLTAGRDAGEMLDALGAAGDRAPVLLVACRPPHPRGLPAAELVAVGERRGIRSEASGSAAEALHLAREAAGADGFVLVCGSLYVVGQARAALR